MTKKMKENQNDLAFCDGHIFLEMKILKDFCDDKKDGLDITERVREEWCAAFFHALI